MRCLAVPQPSSASSERYSTGTRASAIREWPSMRMFCSAVASQALYYPCALHRHDISMCGVEVIRVGSRSCFCTRARSRHYAPSSFSRATFSSPPHAASAFLAESLLKPISTSRPTCARQQAKGVPTGAATPRFISTASNEALVIIEGQQPLGVGVLAAHQFHAAAPAARAAHLFPSSTAQSTHTSCYPWYTALPPVRPAGPWAPGMPAEPDAATGWMNHVRSGSLELHPAHSYRGASAQAVRSRHACTGWKRAKAPMGFRQTQGLPTTVRRWHPGSAALPTNALMR
eukprot:353414-Chlamydomonas_euryale.AAC.9